MDNETVTPLVARTPRILDPFLGIEALILVCAQLSVFFSTDPTLLPVAALSALCLLFSALRLATVKRPRTGLQIVAEVAIIVTVLMFTANGAIIVLGIAFVLRNAEFLPPRRALLTSVAGVGIALAMMVGVALLGGKDPAATIDTALALLMAIGVTGALASFAASERRALTSLRRAHDDLRRYAGHAAQSAAERERARIAADLHDAIGHALTALNVQLQGAIGMRAERPAQADALVDSALVLGQAALASVRETVSALRDDPLERDPLDRVLLRIIGRHQTAGSPAIAAAMTPHVEAPAVATVIARIAEEALVNAVKHAGARSVNVALVVPRSDLAQLEIGDDGCGFDPREQVSGHGLQIMRERAQRAGIDLDVTSAPGGGTRVRLRWQPLVPEA